MQCPVDGATLVISDRSGVEIDYCPTCRGVWLDRGELDKIIDRSAAAQPQYQPQHQPHQPRARDDRDYQDRGYEQGGKPRKKRGGFLEDLFDF